MSAKTKYPSTSWSLLDRVAAGQAEALSQFLLLYQPPMRAHLQWKRRMKQEDAEDALQGFIADKIIERQMIARAKRSEGRKFRTYLLLALDRYVVSLWRKTNAGCRAPEAASIVQYDECLDVPAEGLPVSDVFDVEWARLVVQQAMDQAYQECEEKGQLRLWQAFDARVLGPTLEGHEPPSYAELVARFSFASPSEASNAVVTGQRKLERHLRQVVRQYTSESSVEEEIQDLIAILGKSRA